MERHLYVMLSSTKTGMGKLIRAATGYPYNHVSLSSDDSLRRWFSFARINKSVPLVGGLVEETPERFASAGDSMPVLIYRVPFSELSEEIIRCAVEHREELTYNTYSAVTSLLHLAFPIPGAYTCLDFANVVLNTNYHTIRELNEHLQQYEFYEGDFFALVSPEENAAGEYYDEKGTLTVYSETIAHFADLTHRAIHKSSFSDPIADIRSSHEV